MYLLLKFWSQVFQFSAASVDEVGEAVVGGEVYVDLV
jgi:hypothetical protein